MNAVLRSFFVFPRFPMTKENYNSLNLLFYLKPKKNETKITNEIAPRSSRAVRGGKCVGRNHNCGC